MANVDVCNLTWDCVQEDKIVYERIKFPKTAKPLLIPPIEGLAPKIQGNGLWKLCLPGLHAQTHRFGKTLYASASNFKPGYPNAYKSLPHSEDQRACNLVFGPGQFYLTNGR